MRVSHSEVSAALAAGNKMSFLASLPKLEQKLSHQGNALIAATYNFQGAAKEFSNLVNYLRISPDNGAKFKSGVSLSSFGPSNAYGTVYLYEQTHHHG
jgi:hypothetical protein